MKTSPPITAASGRALIWAISNGDGWSYGAFLGDDHPELQGTAVHSTPLAAIKEGCADAKKEIRDSNNQHQKLLGTGLLASLSGAAAGGGD